MIESDFILASEKFFGGDALKIFGEGLTPSLGSWRERRTGSRIRDGQTLKLPNFKKIVNI